MYSFVGFLSISTDLLSGRICGETVRSITFRFCVHLSDPWSILFEIKRMLFFYRIPIGRGRINNRTIQVNDSHPVVDTWVGYFTWNQRYPAWFLSVSITLLLRWSETVARRKPWENMASTKCSIVLDFQFQVSITKKGPTKKLERKNHIDLKNMQCIIVNVMLMYTVQ